MIFSSLTPCPQRVKCKGENVTGIQIGAKPDSGFDDPIGMLIDCHRRIEHFLNILCFVANRAQGRALSDEESAAVQSALQYFRVGGQRHTADEEQSVFPRLRAIAGTGAFADLDALETDHRRAGELHHAAETLYSAWIAEGPLQPEQEEQLSSTTTYLRLLYSEHIQMEEKRVFPHAAAALPSKQIAEIGQEFRARRV